MSCNINDNSDRNSDRDRDGNRDRDNNILNYGKYDNFLSKIELDYEDVISEIRNYRLEFKDVRDDVIENEMSFPSFSKCFYEMVCSYGYIPKQNIFCNYYESRWIDKVISDNFCDSDDKDKIVCGLDARLRRSYPSFVRDLMFNLYVYDHCYDVYCLYNVDIDLCCGIDSLIVKGDLLFGVCLYVDTSRSRDYRCVKRCNRHSDYSNVVMIENPLCYENKFKCGDFWLYKESCIEKLIDGL